MSEKVNPSELLTLTAQIVASHVGNNTVDVNELPQLIQRQLFLSGLLTKVPALLLVIRVVKETMERSQVASNGLIPKMVKAWNLTGRQAILCPAQLTVLVAQLSPNVYGSNLITWIPKTSLAI